MFYSKTRYYGPKEEKEEEVSETTKIVKKTGKSYLISVDGIPEAIYSEENIQNALEYIKEELEENSQSDVKIEMVPFFG